MEDVGNAVEHVGGIAKLFSEYGPYIVIGSVFVLAFIAILLLFLKMNNQMLDAILKQIDAKNQEMNNMTKMLFNDGMSSLKPKDDDEKDDEEAKQHPRKDLVKMFVNYRIVFDSAAHPVQKDLHASRIAIYLFHNGNSTPYGFPFIKTSCIYDTGANGSKTCRRDIHSNIPLHAFGDMIAGLSDKELYYANLFDGADSDDSLHRFLIGSDSTSVFMKAIISDDNIIVGFTVCEFKTEQDFSDPTVFKTINESLEAMNASIKYIVANDEVINSVQHIDNN